MTVALLVANVAVFWYQSSLGRQLAPFLERWGLVPATVIAAATGESAQIGALVTPLSAMFLHADWLHLFGNLVYLWFFGRVVEAGLGPARFLAVYALAGCLAALAQVVATPDSTVPAVGASGAVAGLLGAYLVLRWRRGLASPGTGADLLAAALLAVWVATLALGGVRELARVGQPPSPFSWWGHLSGLIGGLVLVSFYRNFPFAFPGAKRRWLRS